MGELLSPVQIWKNFDPVAESLDAELVKSERTGKIDINHYYFTGRHFGTEQSRVYCVMASGGENLPALVVAGEINRPVDVGRLRYWAEKGYAAVGIDYAGELGTGNHTVYPETVGYANFSRAGRHLTYVDADATETAWYEYSLNTMRAVTFALENARTNGEVFLLSLGNSAITACQCLAFDKRILAAAIAFGRIWEEIKGKMELDNAEGSEKELEALDSEEKWLAGICPQSYIPLVEQPVYVAVGTNSVYTDMEDTALAMTRFPNKKSRWLFVPKMLDTLTDELSLSFAAWFELSKSLPALKLPKIAVEAEEGRLFAKIKGGESGEIWYARGEKKRRLNWARPETIDGKAALEVFDDNIPVALFANACEKGIWYSGEMSAFSPKDYAKNPVLSEHVRIVYNSAMGKGGFVPVDVTGEEPVWVKGGVSYLSGPLGLMGVGGNRIGTFSLAEDMILRHFESVLIVDVFSPVKQELEITILQDWFGKRTKYTARAALLGGEMWQKIVLGGQEFRSPQGKTLSGDSLKGLDLMSFSCGKDIIITSILFT